MTLSDPEAGSAPGISSRFASTSRCSSMRMAGGSRHESRSGSEGKTGAGARSVDDRTRRRTDQPRPGNRRRRSRIEHEARFEAVLATLPGLADKSLPEMLKAIGMTLVMKVGGASGPLVGTFFMELGKALPEQPARADLVAAADQAIDAVKARGRSEAGQKTLLDVLVPVQAVFAGVVTPGRLRPRRRKPPIARHRCLQPAAGHPSSAKDPSVIWTRGLARRPS